MVLVIFYWRHNSDALALPTAFSARVSERAVLRAADAAAWRLSGGFRAPLGGIDGLPPKQPGRKRIWLQAVSVGEIVAISPMLEAWHRDGGGLSDDDHEHRLPGAERYRNQVAGIGYFPIDWWGSGPTPGNGFNRT